MLSPVDSDKINYSIANAFFINACAMYMCTCLRVLYSVCIAHHEMSIEMVKELKETERGVCWWTWRCEDEEWCSWFDPHVHLPSHVELIAHVAGATGHSYQQTQSIHIGLARSLSVCWRLPSVCCIVCCHLSYPHNAVLLQLVSVAVHLNRRFTKLQSKI